MATFPAVPYSPFFYLFGNHVSILTITDCKVYYLDAFLMQRNQDMAATEGKNKQRILSDNLNYLVQKGTMSILSKVFQLQMSPSERSLKQQK